MTDQSSPSRSLKKSVVRLPAGLRERIAAAAKANQRSMNAEFVARLGSSFATPDPEDLDALADRLAERLKGRSF